MASEENFVSKGYWSDFSDEGEERHKRFLSDLAKLDKRKHVSPSARREPSLLVSEFHLSNDVENERDKVQLWQLAKTVSQRPSHKNVARKLKGIQRKSLTLPKPLHKSEADKIQREVGYEDVKTQLKAWEPIVYSNRAAANLVFPLNSSNNVFGISSEEFLSDKQVATDLENQIHEILHKNDPAIEEKGEEFSLTLQEMIQRRKEFARLRVRESYRQAKARYQNKIKSKKYHRLARRERIRNQLKEFESLQMKDPEAALKKLEELEKERALERASLRHRSTGKWAKNQAVRAKYDKESRETLSEQLRLSKALTQKVQSDSESTEDEVETTLPPEMSDNPWVTAQTKTESDIQEFLSGYRKFWDKASQQDDNTEPKLPSNSLGQKSEAKKCSNSLHTKEDSDHSVQTALKNAVVSYSETFPTLQEQKLEKRKPRVPPPTKQVEKRSVEDIKVYDENPVEAASEIPSKVVKSSSGTWCVASLHIVTKSEDTNINDLFESLNESLNKKVKQKLRNLKEDLGKRKPENGAHSSREQPSVVKNNRNLLEMKKQNLYADVDEELIERAGRMEPETVTAKAVELEKIKKKKITVKKATPHLPELDPNKFITSKPIKLNTLLPNEINGGNEGLDDSDPDEQVEAKHLSISEAFADDDVIAEFSKEKENIIKSDKPMDIDLSLPGWGEWAGHNIKSSSRKRKRFLVKMPAPPPRKDNNKGNLIINEHEDSAARVHQIQNLPYPFTRVRDFEASIRAPVSGTFIPQSAHRKLIKPALRSKMGTIIEPMDKSVILSKHAKYFERGELIKLDTNIEKKAKH